MKPVKKARTQARRPGRKSRREPGPAQALLPGNWNDPDGADESQVGADARHRPGAGRWPPKPRCSVAGSAPGPARPRIQANAQAGEYERTAWQAPVPDAQIMAANVRL